MAIVALTACESRLPTVASMGPGSGGATGGNVARVAITPNQATIGVNGSVQLTSNFFNNEVVWTSLTPNVAGVSSTGLVVGLGAGTGVIRARLVADTTNSATATITVTNTGTTGTTRLPGG